MCSTPAQRLAEITEAIDDLAAEIALAVREQPPSGPGAGHPPGGHQTAARLAQLWSMLAEEDPEVARRMRGYEG